MHSVFVAAPFLCKKHAAWVENILLDAIPCLRSVSFWINGDKHSFVSDISQDDLRAVDQADVLVLIRVEGFFSTGRMVEAGYALCKRIPIVYVFVNECNDGRLFIADEIEAENIHMHNPGVTCCHSKKMMIDTVRQITESGCRREGP